MNSPKKSVCRICGNTTGNRPHSAREMMLGLGDTFTYLECGGCGCLQLEEIPTDMSRYYPGNYYSFDQHGKFATYLRRCRVRQALKQFNVVGWLLSVLMGPNDAVLAIQRANQTRSAAILDVGCGAGRLLLDLAALGYDNLTGIDPFLEKDLIYPSGPKLQKKHIQDLAGQFDLIMLHHSFEHLDQPQQAMQAIHRLLKPTGQAIIRIPVASSFGWREYGVSWVNLDAPRHFFLHTITSMQILANQAGLQLQETRHEGGAEMFWASEQYRAGISMTEFRSLKNSPWRKLQGFVRSWRDRKRALHLNESAQGDVVCFRYSKPATVPI